MPLSLVHTEALSTLTVLENNFINTSSCERYHVFNAFIVQSYTANNMCPVYKLKK